MTNELRGLLMKWAAVLEDEPASQCERTLAPQIQAAINAEVLAEREREYNEKVLECKKGDVFLCNWSTDGLPKALTEVEVLAVSRDTTAIKVKSQYYGGGWFTMTVFQETVIEYLGRWETSGILWKTRKFIKEEWNETDYRTGTYTRRS